MENIRGLGNGNYKEDWNDRYRQDPGIAIYGAPNIDVRDKTTWKVERHIHDALKQNGISYINLDVAEFGCGVGRMLTLFPEAKYRTGYDISSEAIQLANELNTESDMRFVEISDVSDVGEHDIIYTFLVLQHLREQDAMDTVAALVSKARIACVVDFPTPTKPHEDIDDRDTWTGRQYRIETLKSKFGDKAKYHETKDRVFITFINKE